VASRSVRAALTDASPFELRSLGSHRLRGISDGHDLYQLVAADLLDGFPPLRLGV
jgi:class 3 adenylate cyclase